MAESASPSLDTRTDLRSIWTEQGKSTDSKAQVSVHIIDQTCLPFLLKTIKLTTSADFEFAIKTMQVRGAPLIGVTAAYAMYIASSESLDQLHGVQYTDTAPSRSAAFLETLRAAATRLKATRPTAVNLAWAVDKQFSLAKSVVSSRDGTASSLLPEKAVAELLRQANAICEEDVDMCKRIGESGARLFSQLWERKRRLGPRHSTTDSHSTRLNILTHCNAGFLACVHLGTATSPIYTAHRLGIPIHVWVRETRPRLQGARLTAWELQRAGVPHTVVADNAGGWLMRQGWVDAVVTGADRVARNGDVCNKIGTYSLSLCAADTHVPFYVAFPTSTIDFAMPSGDQIPIEFRHETEVTEVQGTMVGGTTADELVTVRAVNPTSTALNPAFDVTPARLVTALITERGVCKAGEEGIGVMYPEGILQTHVTYDISAPQLVDPLSAPADGVIKFHLHWERTDMLASISRFTVGNVYQDQDQIVQHLSDLNDAREKLYSAGLIGSYPDGIGFGNVSMMLAAPPATDPTDRPSFLPFLITGTQTGGLRRLDPFMHYTVVSAANTSRNELLCVGPAKASSESMTHAAVYEAGGKDVLCVMHLHSPHIWRRMVGDGSRTDVPCTRADVAYGTPAMSQEVRRLFETKEFVETGFFAMAGHEDGIVVFGRSLSQSWNRVRELVQRFGDNHAILQ
ncbi:hypothetical protein HDU93_000199 [Gonapodya sp. JEL0774]|nr:hypothetical protein HDU93_000199 [Gonapodya sp. JEL0774]